MSKTKMRQVQTMDLPEIIEVGPGESVQVSLFAIDDEGNEGYFAPGVRCVSKLNIISVIVGVRKKK